MGNNKPLVGIIMGSDSDLPVMEEAVKVLTEFNIGYEVKILSAHRTPQQHSEYSKTAVKRGLKVIIAHGHDFDNLEKILQRKDFVGTVID